MRLLVTGGRTGYLGRHVCRVAAGHGHEIEAVASVECDVRDPDAVLALLRAARPDAVVHTAYRQDDWDVTATGAAHVALAAAEVGARLVLVSSDVVFSGSAPSYAESARPDPITAYGAAKAAAETVALAVCVDVVVARTSVILGDGQSPHERLVHDLAAGGEGALFDDELRCAVHVEDLASALVELAANDHRGVIHLGGADPVSRLELGRLVAARDGLDVAALRGASRAALGVPGPLELRLDSSLASRLLSTRLRGAREFL
ncbi:MAG: sugar nucleotide-binding protein [Nocardioides sp.]|nr:sugar nucleotide-binding protein [Nocardioides sp.]